VVFSSTGSFGLLFCFVKFFHRRGRDLPEFNLALGVDVDSIFQDGQLAVIDSGNVGDLSTCSVLCHDDASDVRTFSCCLTSFELEGIIVICVGYNCFEQFLVIHGTFTCRLFGFKQVLVADDFGLASLPEEIWRAKLAMPDSSTASSVTSVKQPEEALVGE